jgi:hypothetical protein
MPGPHDLHRLDSGGETVIFAGRVQLFRFAEDDTAMRHVAAAVLRQLGFRGQDVAAVLGLTPNYVATLHQRALREGTAGLARPPRRAPGDRRGVVGAGEAVAGGRGAGRGDRTAAGGEPVHRAATAGPGARAGPAAAGGPGRLSSPSLRCPCLQNPRKRRGCPGSPGRRPRRNRRAGNPRPRVSRGPGR